MGTIKFPKEEIYPKGKYSGYWSEDVKIVEDNVVDNDRWSIVHEVIFEYKGKFYQTYYSEGATELQDEEPFEYDDEIECDEVVKKKVLVEQWVSVD